MNPVFSHTVTRRASDFDVEGMTEVGVPVIVHPSAGSDHLVINFPGCGGDIDGYNNKYRTLADLMQQRIGTVIRMGNEVHNISGYPQSVQADLCAVIDYALDNYVELGGIGTPSLYLMGFSAGASAIAAVCHKYPAISKILLISPSCDAGEDAMALGLGDFTGEVYILAGANDDVVGPEVAPLTSNLVKKASIHRVVIIPECDHQFRGRTNGMIMSKAPVWAFCGDDSFPSPDGGIVLYE